MIAGCICLGIVETCVAATAGIGILLSRLVCNKIDKRLKKRVDNDDI